MRSVQVEIEGIQQYGHLIVRLIDADGMKSACEGRACPKERGTDALFISDEAFEGEFGIGHIEQGFAMILGNHAVKLIEGPAEFFDEIHINHLADIQCY